MVRTCRKLLLLGLLLLVCLFAFAQGNDELKLRDGTLLRGEALSHDADSVVFKTATGVRTFARRDVAQIVFGAVGGGGGLPPGISAGPGLTVKRWYTWRRLLDNPRDASARHIAAAKLSGDGRKIVFCGREGVHTLDADGGGLTQITAEPTNRCDISADGKRVAWFNAKEGIVVCGADGSGRTAVPGGLQAGALRLTGDGGLLFVLDTEKDGVFRVRPDGSEIRRIAATKAVAQANGVDENRNHWRADSLDVSDDGRRLVFRFLWDAFTLDTASGRLRQITQYLTPEDRNLQSVRISPDGGKVAFHYYGGPEKHFITVQSFDGAEVATHNGLGTGMSDMDVLADGTVFGGGNCVRLLHPDGRTRDEIFGFAEAPMFDTPYGATCSADGRRMVLVTDGVVSVDQGRGSQLHRIDVKPASLAGCPTLEDIRALPLFVPVDGATTTTISARPGDVPQLNMVYAYLTRENLLGYDVNLARYGGDGWLVDNATRGDTKAMDGTYTGNQFTPHMYVTRPIEPGPLTLRVFARTRDAKMTVVDVEGISARG